MIPGHHTFYQYRCPPDGQSRQEKRRLDLRTSYCFRHGRRLQGRPRDRDRWPILGGQLDQGSHPSKRLRNAAHRPAGERRIARQTKRPGPAGQGPREETHGCSGIAAIKVHSARQAPGRPRHPATIGCPFDTRPELTQHHLAGPNISTGIQSTNERRPRCQRSQDSCCA